MSKKKQKVVEQDRFTVANSWESLRKFTDARIGLGRTGSSLPTKRMLEFQMDHANARDAVLAPMDFDKVRDGLTTDSNVLILNSQARDLNTYIQRPDLGRRLDQDSVKLLERNHALSNNDMRACIVVADGLSSIAVQSHAAAMCNQIVTALDKEGISMGPICMVNQGRVAIGDEIGELLQAELVILLVGERPGLSSPDSLGIYYTYSPRIGRQDSERNCISNIRPAGLSYQEATDKLIWLVLNSIKLGLSGVKLKDESDPYDPNEERLIDNFLIK